MSENVVNEADLTLDQARAYFTDRIGELKKMVEAGTPWVFLCGSAFIDYLSRLAAGKDAGSQGYKDFVNEYMPLDYKSFRYKCGKTDLPDQMYHILRCGIVHSFSFFPDAKAANKGGRERSIVLTHDGPHVSRHSRDKAPDACCLRADCFVRDLEFALNSLFTKAKTSQQLRERIVQWWIQHPPISAGV